MLVYQRVYDVIWNPCPELPKNWNLTQAWIEKTRHPHPENSPPFASSAHHPSAPQDLSYKIGEADM